MDEKLYVLNNSLEQFGSLHLSECQRAPEAPVVYVLTAEEMAKWRALYKWAHSLDATVSANSCNRNVTAPSNQLAQAL